MTDDTMRDLVTKHDLTITQLVTSVEHLVASQTETNKRLEEISKFLAKQVVFSTKLDNMDRELTESFRRVHARIDEMDKIQKSDFGCSSVKLISKDIETMIKSINKLAEHADIQDTKIEAIETYNSGRISSNTIKWGIGLFLPFFIMLSVYYVTSINDIKVDVVKITENLKKVEK